MSNEERPTPTGPNWRGEMTYNGAEVNAWRMSRGVTVSEVAHRLGITQGGLSHYLDGRFPLKEDQAERIFRAVEYLSRDRGRMREEGAARLAAIRRGEAVDSDTRRAFRLLGDDE